MAPKSRAIAEAPKVNIPHRTHPFIRTLQGVGAAAGFAVAGLAGLNMINDAPVMEEKIIIADNNAEPSNEMSDLFQGLEDILALAGAGYAGIYCTRKVYASMNDRAAALEKFASKGKSRSGLRVIGAAGLTVLTTAVGINTYDTAVSVGSSQINAADVLRDQLGKQEPGEGTYLLSSSPHPELASNTTLPATVLGKIIDLAATSGNKVSYDLDVVPGRFQWSPTHRYESKTNLTYDKNKKIQALPISLPIEVINRGDGPDQPVANKSCTHVPVGVAQELGLKVGDEFDMEGLKLTVNNVLDGRNSGVNLVPIVFSNDDFARCLTNNEKQPYNFALAQGKLTDIKAMLTAAGIKLDGLDKTERVYIVTLDDFFNNTLQTGKNNVDPFTLNLMMVLMALSAYAIAGLTRAEIAKSSAVNAMQHANGMTKREIASIYHRRVANSVMMSWPLGVAVGWGIDISTNFGTPGAELAPNLNSAFFALGATGLIAIGSTATAVRKELLNMNIARIGVE